MAMWAPWFFGCTIISLNSLRHMMTSSPLSYLYYNLTECFLVPPPLFLFFLFLFGFSGSLGARLFLATRYFVDDVIAYELSLLQPHGMLSGNSSFFFLFFFSDYFSHLVTSYDDVILPSYP